MQGSVRCGPVVGEADKRLRIREWVREADAQCEATARKGCVLDDHAWRAGPRGRGYVEKCKAHEVWREKCQRAGTCSVPAAAVGVHTLSPIRYGISNGMTT
jgi:hypothetical protein